MADIDFLYSKALNVGITPTEFWNMSIKEVIDAINERYKQKQDDIYTLSLLIRVAVASVLSPENKFPKSSSEAFGRERDHENDWQRSKEYFSQLASIHKGGKG